MCVPIDDAKTLVVIKTKANNNNFLALSSFVWVEYKFVHKYG